MEKHLSCSATETEAIAKQLAHRLSPPATITLTGNLGAGKTAFAKAFIEALVGNKTEVTSPTFTICNIYGDDNNKIYHFDLYRLKNENELPEIGIEDAFDSICLIEWPEIAEDILPDSRINIRIDFGQNENERIISIESKGRAE